VFKIKTQINRLRRHKDLIITLSFTKQFDTTFTRAYEQFYDFIKVATRKHRVSPDLRGMAHGHIFQTCVVCATWYCRAMFLDASKR
jgi:hypothetical protein